MMEKQKKHHKNPAPVDIANIRWIPVVSPSQLVYQPTNNAIAIAISDFQRAVIRDHVGVFWSQGIEHPLAYHFVTCKKIQEYTNDIYIYIYVILCTNNTCIYLIHDISTTFPPCAIRDWTNLWTIWLWGPTLRWGLQAARLERSMATWTQTDQLNHQIYQPQKSLFT